MYQYKYSRVAVTADIILFDSLKLKILLIQRGGEPYKGMWALPGGFMDMNETIEQTAYRELEEETGITGIELNQLYTFSEVNRDPRHRTISTVFYGIFENEKLIAEAGDDAVDAKCFDIYNLPELAFDHREIVDFFISSNII
jgi:8-oxo-dGTP diphosphatase